MFWKREEVSFAVGMNEGWGRELREATESFLPILRKNSNEAILAASVPSWEGTTKVSRPDEILDFLYKKGR